MNSRALVRSDQFPYRFSVEKILTINILKSTLGREDLLALSVDTFTTKQSRHHHYLCVKYALFSEIMAE